MKKLCYLMIPLLLLTLSLVVAQGRKIMYVQSKAATLREHPSKETSKDVKVERGAKLETIKYDKNWYKVTYQSKTGWIYKGKVAKDSPKADKSLTASTKGLMAGEEAAAGSAIRGLGPLSQKFAGQNPVSDEQKRYTDYHQSYITTDKENFAPTITERVEVVKITTQDLENFMKAGKLGEFNDVAVQD